MTTTRPANTFKEGCLYAIERGGYVRSNEQIRVIRRGKTFITYERVSGGNTWHLWDERNERAKIRRHTIDGSEFLLLPDGFISDFVSADEIRE